ncbi:MAG: bifunctional glutamate N-acetyltransferase/amino-acid acetyltransferase ArgJ [Desulfobacterales bacterium]|nr:bifunctional glutamate N-acetyltransferase/amino-acid acetyltransferase ArgJ [Desulfobacterales bacterium]MBS3755076.1 bifunctional glutamate N-acetyltransferase/amino-acid acetyltransferase ArgJ [Desulfobacterales bacterium]
MAKGFQAAAVSAGIKKNGKKDLALIVSDAPAAVAGVFTRNRVQAAPVVLDRQRLAGGTCRAIIANSGNANCATKQQGIADAVAMTRSVSDALEADPQHVMAASTGVIGVPLPVDKILSAVPDLVAALDPDGFADAAEGIMTTDTKAKLVRRQEKIDGQSFQITAMAKGAGMIRPDMATMLCFVCTDIDMDAPSLQQALAYANERSFNRITIDGDTSTNDTVLVMANGRSGAAARTPEQKDVFSGLLAGGLEELARKIVADGEGATKCVEIAVINAHNEKAARQAADTVANSNLVKTAFYGEDANWGRILAALGRAGVEFDPERVDIWFGDVRMVENGAGCGDQTEAAATQVLRNEEFSVFIDLKSGTARASVLTCDFSVDYVKINADYRS